MRPIVTLWAAVAAIVMGAAACGSDKKPAEERPAPAPVAAAGATEAPTADEPGATGDEAPAAAAGEAAATEGGAGAAAEEAPAKAEIGNIAPDFTLTDLDGKPFRLSEHRGKTVILEWFNPDCPFVVYAYGDKGPLRGMAKTRTDQGVVWAVINSGAPGKQGAGADRNRKAVADYAMTAPVLLDEDGKVGQAYEARTTPHMYVIDPTGVLVYRGGLDNAPLGEAPAGEPVRDYVGEALEDLSKGQAVRTPDTRPYGCSVKYAM